jgi:type II secretory pathway pseudopilin PulG
MDAPRAGAYPRAMRKPLVSALCCRHGFSLVELGVVLCLLGLVLTLALPRLRHAREVLAVRAARAELAGAIAAARANAVLAGGATLVVDPYAHRAWIEAADGRRAAIDYPLGSRYGVRIETERGTPVSIRYDALGIGRMANATLGVRRGDIRMTLTVSAYGRVRL